MFLGAEASGKTTMIEQLRCLASSHGANVRDGAAINVAPTTGQELDTITFTTQFRFLPKTARTGSSAAVPRPDTGAELPGLVAEQHPAVSSLPEAKTSVVGRDWQPVDITLSVKEVGGRMMASWQRFVSGADAGRNLVYVVDASAPWTLPTASVEFFSLLAEHGCMSWRILVVINKTRLPGSMAAQDVAQMMCLPHLQEIHSDLDLTVVVADAWSGEGLDDVVRWLMRADAPPRSTVR